MPMRLAFCLPLLLAACGQPTPVPAPTATAAAANGYASKVAALSPRLRAGVLLRAVRDAGQDCQSVGDQKQVAPAAWLATCDGQRRWVVAIGGDGTATVVDAKDVAGGR